MEHRSLLHLCVGVGIIWWSFHETAEKLRVRTIKISELVFGAIKAEQLQSGLTGP